VLTRHEPLQGSRIEGLLRRVQETQVVRSSSLNPKVRWPPSAKSAVSNLHDTMAPRSRKLLAFAITTFC
jgi:hypothetical protein